MTIQDQVFLAIVGWKENRGGGVAGTESVMNVIINRAKTRNTDPYTECVKPLQFSSLTAAGDPELIEWPNRNNSADWQAWQEALNLASQATVGTLEDTTGGATLYYAPATIAKDPQHQNFRLPDGTVIPFPRDWNLQAVTYTCTIESQVFFRE
jgi:hypothetical protein